MAVKQGSAHALTSISKSRSRKMNAVQMKATPRQKGKSQFGICPAARMNPSGVAVCTAAKLSE